MSGGKVIFLLSSSWRPRGLAHSKFLFIPPPTSSHLPPPSSLPPPSPVAQVNVPIVFRGPNGCAKGVAAQHSQVRGLASSPGHPSPQHPSPYPSLLSPHLLASCILTPHPLASSPPSTLTSPLSPVLRSLVRPLPRPQGVSPSAASSPLLPLSPCLPLPFLSPLLPLLSTLSSPPLLSR